MDQVKVILRQLQKHHFWVLSVVTLLIALTCWWMGANSLASATAAHESEVKKGFSDMQDVEKNGHPANARFSEGVNAKHDEVKNKVLAEWKERFVEQQKLFTWPALIAGEMARVKPDDPIPDDVRLKCKSNEVFLDELYNKVFPTADYRHSKEAVAKAEAAAVADKGDAAAAVEPAAEEGDTIVGLVVWNKHHRAALEQRYNLRRQSGTPSTLNIRLAQEDMWMLENLAKVIRQTNAGAQDVIAVPIKRIDSLDIAQWAINEAVRESPKVFADSTESTAAAPFAGNAGAVEAPTDPAERDKLADEELLNGRYLGDTGQPLQAADGGPYAEFKLMFVRMKVVIDQRKIPELLVNCANAPIPIEVVRFRMDEPLVGTGVKPGNAGGGGGGLGGLRGSAASGGLAGARGGLGAAVQAAPAAGDQGDEIEPNPSDVTVEVCGIVQLYTAPDAEKLGTGSAADPGKRPAGVPTAQVKEPRGSGGSGAPGGLKR